MTKVLVTGGAGFIGSHLIDFLLAQSKYHITCLDNFDPFYKKVIKQSNIANALSSEKFEIISGDLLDIDQINFRDKNFDIIVHLAAKAGVRPSIANPIGYQKNNALGTMIMLEFAKKHNIKQFIYASSSSVYGVSEQIPWSENNSELRPISPYASSKISGEWSGRVYSHLYGIRFIALRFFTVYGERQRPDLAIHKFVKNIENNIPITMYGNGSTERDYTYWQDIISGIYSAMHYTESPYEIINLGNNLPVKLSKLIEVIENAVGKKSIIQELPEQEGDVPRTFANIEKAKTLLGYTPQTELSEGIKNFHKWYLDNLNLLG